VACWLAVGCLLLGMHRWDLNAFIWCPFLPQPHLWSVLTPHSWNVGASERVLIRTQKSHNCPPRFRKAIDCCICQVTLHTGVGELVAGWLVGGLVWSSAGWPSCWVLVIDRFVVVLVVGYVSGSGNSDRVLAPHTWDALQG